MFLPSGLHPNPYIFCLTLPDQLGRSWHLTWCNTYSSTQRCPEAFVLSSPQHIPKMIRSPTSIAHVPGSISLAQFHGQSLIQIRLWIRIPCVVNKSIKCYFAALQHCLCLYQFYYQFSLLWDSFNSNFILEQLFASILNDYLATQQLSFYRIGFKPFFFRQWQWNPICWRGPKSSIASVLAKARKILPPDAHALFLYLIQVSRNLTYSAFLICTGGFWGTVIWG